RPLAPEQARAIDERGFIVWPDVASRDDVESMRACCDAWRDDPVARAGGGNQRLERLQDRHASIVRAALHPLLLATVWRVLQRPFCVDGVAFRDPRPGLGAQGLHTDWPAHDPREPYFVATALWILDDMNAQNGATRVVPGSHRRRAIAKDLADPKAHHPDEIVVAARAGALLVFNGHLWHSGTRNDSGARRRVVQMQLRARDSGAEFAAGAVTVVDAPIPSAARAVVHS
ncbi:MAG TPA: phytanoyl-CoA dioxygenase family protein, partial [Myxococcota bacterium]